MARSRAMVTWFAVIRMRTRRLRAGECVVNHDAPATVRWSFTTVRHGRRPARDGPRHSRLHDADASADSPPVDVAILRAAGDRGGGGRARVGTAAAGGAVLVGR